MKIDWASKFLEFGVRDCQHLVNKLGGLAPAARKTLIPKTSIQTKLIYEEKEQANKRLKVFYFTDTHTQPGLETSHLEWIGKYIKDTQPDKVIHGGDFADFESLCSHVSNDTLGARLKPSVRADFDAMDEAMAIINEASGYFPIHKTDGNHEVRIWSFENQVPELHEMLAYEYNRIHKKNGWTYSPYMEYHTVHGVDFTHVPQSMPHKARGGLNACHAIASKAQKCVVFGHTHMDGVKAHKFDGPNRYIRAVNGGCTMPIGYRPKYTTGGPTGWWHGVVELEIEHGKIEGYKFIRLEELRDRYA